jgi:DNA polymerase phi
MFPDGRARKKSPISTVNTEAEPAPIDVLVDIIIGFLEKSTAYMRTVGNQVFSLLSGSVQGTTIDLILSVCPPAKSWIPLLLTDFVFSN